MKTQITELFGIEHPIIQGGMHYVGLQNLLLQYQMQVALELLQALLKVHLKNLIQK